MILKPFFQLKLKLIVLSNRAQIANTLGEMEWELGTDHRVVGEPELGELYVTRCTYDDRVRHDISGVMTLILPLNSRTTINRL